ncbi:MAG: 50S ribosomal protein L15e [Candidatus Aenigmarchaeota archaeon]|nr:50S ribosomal protein L15e [Candidatus Aenigmarchaeota archaeon]
MSLYSSLRTAWKKPKPLYKQKLIGWRRQNVVERVDKPTRLDRARQLGYKAKQGYVVVRTRIRKGGRLRPKLRKGRGPSNRGRYVTTKQSLQAIAEKRVARKFPNLEVLNSYYVGEDGKQFFYEMILVDPQHPVVRKDPKINWIVRQRKRVFRGLTSAGKKSRGL